MSNNVKILCNWYNILLVFTENLSQKYASISIITHLLLSKADRKIMTIKLSPILK